MAPATARSRRKPRDRYHHGDLRRALLDDALAIIRHDGVGALTLRRIGLRLGVSRTALYRHFADKQALLTVVATDGFRMLTERLLEAWGSGGRRGFQAMGVAYIRFATMNPSHYRVMFGGFVDQAPRDEELAREATAAFRALVDALAALQREGVVRPDDPVAQARFVWATVHGISMLIIDGQLGQPHSHIDALIELTIERILTGIARPGRNDR